MNPEMKSMNFQRFPITFGHTFKIATIRSNVNADGNPLYWYSPGLTHNVHPDGETILSRTVG